MADRTEVLIIKNPFFYKDLAVDAYDYFMSYGGRWIPIVFGVIEKIVKSHFLDLCELDWDYIKEADETIQKTHRSYKSIFYKGLNPQQEQFIRDVADEIEQELKTTAQEALAAAQLQGTDDE